VMWVCHFFLIQFT